MRIILIIITILIQGSLTYGQQTFKEIKSLTKKHSYKKGDKIIVSGERTFIDIKTWNQDFVEANIEVIARYKNKAQAQKDLEVINVYFDKSGGDIYFSNAIQIFDIKDKPKSNLKTILQLKVPKHASIEINNSFGDLNLTGNINNINVISKFCTSNISGFAGELTLDSEYGVLEIHKSKGKIKVDGNRSDLSLNEVGGEIKVGMEFGKLDIKYSDDPINYKIKTKYTPISIFIRPDPNIYHDIICKDCDVVVDNCEEITKETFSRKRHELTIGSAENKRAKSEIKSESENITIISINSQVSTK